LTCIAEIRKSPLFSPRDVSHVSVNQIYNRLTMSLCDSTRPETDMLDFYVGVQALGLMHRVHHEHEVVRDDLYRHLLAWRGRTAKAVGRALLYSIVICTREMRHCGSKDDPELEKRLVDETSLDAASFVRFMMAGGGAPDGILSCAYVPVGDAFRAVDLAFREGMFGKQFGGEPWAQVARNVVRYVDGSYTPEMFLDTVWSLCHNNGPIFNKGMHYDMYSNYLIELLDVQRSGQVIEGIVEGRWVHFLTKETSTLAYFMKDYVRDLVGDYVDWSLVEEAGSLMSYDTYKANQLATKDESAFWVMPDLVVKKVERDVV